MARLALGVNHFQGQDPDIVEHLTSAINLFLAASRIRPLEPAPKASDDEKSESAKKMMDMPLEFRDALSKHEEDVKAGKLGEPMTQTSRDTELML